ncbi:hypothetical protein [Pseudanabaena sp. ABRG5-3]|uniref:hypothetical protein n=1 Tax=Pseudanabaena sp. ABRG5-3 TaxID=685565 RepID=UPI000DC7379C|nr:hypothetical protein [Pseudanabaena sp. ABRG5-3]BBC24380.1 hypothetical protein ABRG53_2123 [Pseudanabaena sp. ABRG5-3]
MPVKIAIAQIQLNQGQRVTLENINWQEPEIWRYRNGKLEISLFEDGQYLNSQSVKLSHRFQLLKVFPYF